MKHKRLLTFLSLLLCCVVFSIQSRAAEGNVVIRLDLSNYDSFNERVAVTCQSASGNAVCSELTVFNDYEISLNLEPDLAYEISLSVIGDDLHLVDLSPMQFTVQAISDTVQTFTIEVQDSAGMEAENSSHKDFLYEEESADEPKEPELYDSSQGTEKTGELFVTGPDVAGVTSVTYTLLDEEGKRYEYALKKEHDFKAVIQLPFGRYMEEFAAVSVEPEEGITIPEDVTFYCKYYGNKPGQSIVVDQSRTKQRNLHYMQIWAKRKSGADYKLRNLYQFGIEESISEITGHVDTSVEVVATEEESIGEITTAEPEESGTQTADKETNQHKSSRTWMIIPIMAAVLLSFIIGWRKWRNGK